MEENRLAQWLACLAFLALVLGGEFLIYKYRTPGTAEYIKKADTLTAKRKNVRERAVSQLKDVSTDADVARRMRALLRGKFGEGPTSHAGDPSTWAQQLVKAIAQSNPALHSVALLGPDGTVLAHTDAKQVYSNLAGKLFFKDAMRGEASSEVVYNEHSAAALRVIAVPIRLNGRVVGVLSAAVDISG